jgi:hypothetical protein
MNPVAQKGSKNSKLININPGRWRSMATGKKTSQIPIGRVGLGEAITIYSIFMNAGNNTCAPSLYREEILSNYRCTPNCYRSGELHDSTMTAR